MCGHVVRPVTTVVDARVGHLVIAQENLIEGWWEAVTRNRLNMLSSSRTGDYRSPRIASTTSGDSSFSRNTRPRSTH
jgi:hypothetical protein